MHTMGLSLLDGDLSLDDARGAITSRLDRIPKYRKKLRFVPFNLAQPTLVDDQNFAIDNHVFSHSLAQGATVEDAFSLAMELGEKPLHREAPLWAMHLISGFGSTLLVHISHLALLDGMSIGEDAHVFFDLHREPPEIEPQTWTAKSSSVPVKLSGEYSNTHSVSGYLSAHSCTSWAPFTAMSIMPSRSRPNTCSRCTVEVEL